MVGTITEGDFDCSASSGQQLDCTLLHLGAGETKSITVAYSVDTDTDAASAVSNTAEATSDEQTVAASGSETVDIVENVVLHVTKTFSSDTVTAGGSSQQFTIVVSNTGTSSAEAVSVTDTVDTRLHVTAIGGGGFTCGAPSQSLSCTLGSLAAGDSKTITVTYEVASDVDSATVSNDASVSSDEDSAGPSTDSVDIVEDVDLSVEKTFDSATVAAGGASKSFTISVHNAGASDADNVSVSDTVDNRLEVGTIDEGDFDCSTSSGQQVDCTLLHLGAGETESITVHYTVDTTTEADPVVGNTTSAESDENGATTGSDDVAIVENVVLDVTKTFADDSVDAGTLGHTFTITVTNNGASEADDVIVTDEVDSRLIVTDVTGADCSAWAGQHVECTVPELAAGDSATVTVTYEVAASTAAATVSNTGAAVSDDSGSGSDSDSVDIATKANIADLKVATPEPVLSGNQLTYTITVSNDGPSDAQAVTLTDVLDSALVLPMYTLDYGSGPGVPMSWLGSVNLGTLAPGDSVDVVITATVDPSTQPGMLSNTATVSSSTDDPDESDNTSTAETTVDTEADLSISKAAPVSATAGDPSGFDYTFTVTNDGPSDNTGGFDVTDTLDSGLTFETAGSDPRCAAAGQLVTCTNTTGLGTTFPNDTDTFTIHVTLASTVDSSVTLSNTAGVYSNGTADPNSVNDTSNTTSTDVDEDVSLAVTKAFDSASVTAGGAGKSFTIDVKNTGSSDADNVTLNDTVDGRLIVDGVTAGSFSCPDGDADPQTITCTLGHLAAGATKSVTVDYHVASTTNAAAGVSNTASASSDEDGPANGADTVDIVENVSLAVTKAFDSATGDGGWRRRSRSRST